MSIVDANLDFEKLLVPRSATGRKLVSRYTAVVMLATVFLSTTNSVVVSALQQQRLSFVQRLLQPIINVGSIDNVSSPKIQSVQSHQETTQYEQLCRRSVVTMTLSCFISLSLHQSSLLYNNIVANAIDEVETGSVGKGIIRSKGCYQGMGDGCVELSDNNALIQQLQQKSLQNRERNEKEALYAYYMKNYPDFFTSIGQVMIKKSSDNTFLLVTPQEAERMKALNQLSYEIPKTRGGTIIDYTQKPILILKE
jgi:hypothetical protein